MDNEIYIDRNIPLVSNMGKLVMGAGLPTWSSLPMYGFTSSISKPAMTSQIGSVASIAKQNTRNSNNQKTLFLFFCGDTFLFCFDYWTTTNSRGKRENEIAIGKLEKVVEKRREIKATKKDDDDDASKK
jgi:hypothetical protein